LRSAYRLIDTALGDRRAGCANEGAVLASDAATLETSHPEEQQMTRKKETLEAKIKEKLEAQLQDLMDRVAAIDLPAARQRIEQTEEEFRCREREHTSDPGTRTFTPGYGADTLKARDEAAAAKKAAVIKLRELEQEELRLRAEVSRVRHMLTSTERVAGAEAAIAETKAMMDAAGEQVARSKRTLESMKALIETEKQALEVARAGAAAELLAAVKAGADVSAVKNPVPEKLATLEAAHAAAADELAAAQAAYAAARAGHQRAVQDADDARADVAVCAEKVASEAYVEALVAAIGATNRASKRWRDGHGGFPDPYAKARDLAWAQLLKEGLA
jgi:hypothetical protein